MEIRLLGPLEVLDAQGRSVVVRGRRPRALLAVLALHPNQAVSTEELIRALWGGQPPRSARDSIHFFVHQLRGALGEGNAAVRTRGGSYLLEADPEQVDVARFLRLADEARAAHLGGALEAAWEASTQAAALWRGPALSGLGEPFAEIERTRLEQRRVAAVEVQVRIGLDLGRHADLVGELEALVTEHPLREGLWELWMLALYRSGRQAEALDAYQAVRAELITHGLEPGDSLQRLQRAILAQDPSLAGPRPATESSLAPESPPAPGPPTGKSARRQATPAPSVVGGPSPPAASAPSDVGGPRRAAGPAPSEGGGTWPAAGHSVTTAVSTAVSAAATTGPAPQPAPRGSEGGRTATGRRDERRTVTVLVVGVNPRLHEDPEAVRDLVAVTSDRIRALVGRYGGVVQTEAMGRLLAVFGALQSHDDDPERAVRAALDLRSEAGVAGIGVATGEVVVTLTEPVTEPVTRPGTEPGTEPWIRPGTEPWIRSAGPDPAAGQVELAALAGEVLSQAASLAAGAAPRTVRVGTHTHAATRQMIQYTPVPAGGGHDRPATPEAWEAVTARARTGARLGEVTGPLVERERELALLTGVVQRLLRDGEPQLVTLVGAPGVGKTRLVGELGRLMDRAQELVTWRVGRCLPYGQGGLWALAEIVKAHAGILDSDTAEAARDKLAQTTADLLPDPADAAHTLRQLRALLESPDRLPASDQTADLVEGWSRWFAAAAEQRPTVLVIEDLQWADDLLLDFVEQLTDRVGPVPLLVAGTARLELLERRPVWGGGKRDAVTLSLAPLSPAGTTALLEAFLLLGQVRVPDETREALVGWSGGNPLYVEEYVRMLRERGGAEGTLPMPETVQQVIAARIDTLPRADRLLLRDAAVIGEVGWVGALASVSGHDRTEVEAALRRLERLEFLRRVRTPSVGGESEYAFRHALIREVAASQVLRAERAAKHRRVAAWIQELTADPGDRADLIAYHYGQAVTLASAAGQPGQELTDLARRSFRAAGDRAFALGALPAAARHYQRALELWPANAPDRPELQVRLGQALVYSARTGEEVLAEAREAALAAERPDLAVEADVLRSQLARTLGDERAAGEHAQRALEAQRDHDTPDHATAAALQSRAIYLLVQDRHTEAVATARQVTDLGRRLGLPEYEGIGLSIAGHARMVAGDLGGLEDAGRAVELAEIHRSPLSAFTHFGEAHSLFWYGDLERAEAAVTTGREVVQEAGAAIASWFDGVQAGLDYAAGRWEAVMATTGQALARQHTGQDAYMVTLHHTLRAMVRLGRGDPKGALADAEAARSAGISGGEVRYRQVGSAIHARALLAAGQRDQAAACLEELLAEQRQRPSQSCVTPEQVALMLELGEAEGALPGGLPPTRWHQAVQALAARDLPRAIERFEAVGSRVDAAQARLRLAAELTTGGRHADARAALVAAAPVLGQAAALRDLEKVHALGATLAAGP